MTVLVNMPPILALLTLRGCTTQLGDYDQYYIEQRAIRVYNHVLKGNSGA